MKAESESKAVQAVCVVCGTAVDNVLLNKDGLDVRRCSECGLAFTHPRPQCLDAQYDSSYFDLYRKRRDFRLRRSNSRLRRIETLKKPGHLLDIGCSLGYFVEAAARRGWDAEGLEISPFAAEEARRMGLNVRTGVLEDAGYDSGAFDCVTMWDVLEHVPDPVRHMLEVRRILADGGLVVVGTPDIGHLLFRLKRERWRHLKPAEHIYYFCRSSIRRLMASTGFDLVSVPGTANPLSGLVRVFARFTQINDVMTVYGVNNGLEIPIGGPVRS